MPHDYTDAMSLRNLMEKPYSGVTKFDKSSLPHFLFLMQKEAQRKINHFHINGSLTPDAIKELERRGFIVKLDYRNFKHTVYWN